MSLSPNFLVIDFNAESRQLLVRTLRRKFAQAVVYETDDAEKAVAIARAVDFAAIVTHRTFDLQGPELVRRLRDADPAAVIVMVSGLDREAEALHAGATSFLSYDEWLRIGTVLEDHLNRRASPASVSRPELA